MRIIRQNSLILIVLLTTFCFSQNKWTDLGQIENVQGGSVACLAGYKDSLLLAGTTFGGLFKSVDGGNSWQFFDFKDENVEDLLFYGDILYCIHDHKVSYSDDFGRSWNDLSKIPSSPTRMIVCNDEIWGATVNGPYKLNILDNKWTKMTTTFHAMNNGCGDIVTDTSGIIITASMFDQEGGGLFKSLDSGQTWIDISPMTNTKIVKAVELDKNHRLWAGGRDGLNFSDDLGETWQHVDDLGYAYIMNLVIREDGLMICGTLYDDFYYSTDGGETWKFHDTVYAIFDYCFFENGEILLCGSKGIFRSSDISADFIESNVGFFGANFYDLQFDGDKLYVASNVGLYESDDYGNSYNLLLEEYGGKDNSIREISIRKGNIFAIGFDCGVYRKKKNEKKWIALDYIPNGTHIIQGKDGVVIAGTESCCFYLSKDYGDNWEYVDIPGRFSVRSMLITSKNRIIIGVVKADEDPWFIGYYYSDDEGKTWERKVLEQYYQAGLTVNSLAQLSNGDILASSVFGIYRSKNDGDTWTKIFGGIDDHSDIIKLTVVDEKIIIGTTFSQGLIISEDNGKNWNEIEGNSEITGYRLQDAEVSDDGYLYVGRLGGGGISNSPLLRSQFKILQTKDDKKIDAVYKMYELYQNYPNPFNLSTRIPFILSEGKPAKIMIYNLKGDLVAMQDYGNLACGYYVYEFNADQLSTGVYICKLIVENKIVDTQKLLFLK